jgi:6-phosphogluconolactonase
LFFCF